MKMIFKSLLVWLLLLAVPVQGFASVTMFACSPLSSTRVAAFSASAPGFGVPAAHAAMGDSVEHCAAMAKEPGDNA
ncbi:hypothetical protein LP420_38345 [Massilia sp. B-10]|nr:hypothetical protein LP420_38345 [Massilia sp. B-10]UUZ54120.1 hypothetical protein LP419_37795 [Massilia sp. H-1]